jgi:hypothetical protein
MDVEALGMAVTVIVVTPLRYLAIKGTMLL